MAFAGTADFEALRLESVSRRFGEHAALDSLSLTVQRGEFVALLGPSGCGKSTALNCLAGLLTLTSGSIWIDERRIDTLAPEQRGFGMVFQNYALFPHMTVRRNVGFGLAMRNVPKADIRRQVDQALELVQLGHLGERLPGQLSGGQQQRVAIARAIVVQPPLILMDEPLSNLDAKLRLEMRHEIRRIHRELGRSTIYVTHDQDEALSLADRIVVLKDGRMRQIGTPEELYGEPADLDVARFMGYRNILNLEVAGTEGNHVRLGGGGLELGGRVMAGPLNGRATVAIRPEDLSVGDAGPNKIRATVTYAEYCGRDFQIDAVTESGATLFFRTLKRVEPGEAIILGVEPSRVLAFPPE